MRRGLLVVIILLVVVGIIGFIMVSREAQQRADGSVTPGSVASGGVSKPKPIATGFMGCPPSGDGGDPALNTLKNRIDEAGWQPTSISDLLALTWPRAIEQKPRSRWSSQDRQEIGKIEGSPVQVEGYLISVKKMGPETCNCHAVDYVDYHVWLVDDPSKDRSQAVVVEVSPRVQSFHPEWTLRRLQQMARDRQKVRISGWLLMDPEHPDQIGKTRGTIWEIHPIMQIETSLLGQWRPLDSGTTGVKSAQTSAEVLSPPTPVQTATAPPFGNREVQDNKSVHITSIFANGVN
ncbi:MAG TPA: hypothetical protein VM409_06510, partial [Chloroflexia bacterium]|nr:hypothetical protein [Chloroflexia bacterium]